MLCSMPASRSEVGGRRYVAQHLLHAAGSAGLLMTCLPPPHWGPSAGEFIWTEGAGWRKALDVNLGAVLAGIRFAVRAMVGAKTKGTWGWSAGRLGPCALVSSSSRVGLGHLPAHPLLFLLQQGSLSNWLPSVLGHCCAGTILATASAGGLFPMPLSPVYAASKAGVIHAVQSLAEPLQRAYGIRIAALCPQVLAWGHGKGCFPFPWAHAGSSCIPLRTVRSSSVLAPCATLAVLAPALPQFVDTPLVQGMRAQLGEAKAARVMDGMGGRLLTAGQVRAQGRGVVCCRTMAGAASEGLFPCHLRSSRRLGRGEHADPPHN